MKKNLLDKKAAKLIVERANRLEAGNRPRWGSMNATEMLLHCNLCNQQILNEGASNKKTTVKQYLLRILALYIAPHFKKNIKGDERNETAGKIDAGEFEKQKAEFINLIRSFPEHKQPLSLPHIAFGNISTNE